MDTLSAINPAIENYLNDNTKMIDCLLYNEDIEKLLKPHKEKCVELIEDLAGKPYLEIHTFLVDLILEWKGKFSEFYNCPLNLFNLGNIYELPTKEVCEFIKESYDKSEANMIYIHGSYTGIEENSILKSKVFDTKPNIKSFDKYPNPIYVGNVYKMNVKDPIPECDKDKRILAVYCHPSAKMFKDIITGLRINKDNYVGVVFIGDLVRGHCLPKEHNKILNLCKWNLIEYGTKKSICFNEIMDAELLFRKYENMKILKKYKDMKTILHNHRESQQMFYINDNITYQEKPVVITESLNILDIILNTPKIEILISLLIEHTYLIRYFGISWDIKLLAIPQLMNIIIDKAYEQYNDESIQLKEDNLSNELINVYFHQFNNIKIYLNKLTFIKENNIDTFVNIRNDFISRVTMKTPILYRMHIIIQINAVDKYADKYFNYCHICDKKFNFKCSKCKLATYCSKKCQIIDCKYLNHDCEKLKYYYDKYENLENNTSDEKHE